MKKVFTILSVFVVSVSMAQIQQQGNIHGGRLYTGAVKKPVVNSDRAAGSFFVDYDESDADYSVNTMGDLYDRFIWRSNMRYDVTQGDTALKQIIVDYSQLLDTYGQVIGNPGSTYQYSNFTGLTLDSVYVFCGHMNVSGTNDTIMCKVIPLNTNGYPQTGTILNTTQIIQNTSFTGQSTWLQGGVIGFAPNFTINPSQRFAVMIEYYGNKQDTFGILAGFPHIGPSCSANPNLPYFAKKSNYAVNSYRHDMRFALPPNNIQLLPTSSNADTYYECDGNQGYSPGNDSENYLQNWTIWVKLSYTNTNVGINENEVVASLSQNIPNPANGNTLINYHLSNANNVSFEVVDITGKLVHSQNMGMKNAGQHSINLDANLLAPGAYFYTITAGGYKTTKKMIVNR